MTDPRSEIAASIQAFLAFFCLLAAYFVLRPLRDQLGGAVALPWFYAAIFVVTLALTPVFGGLAARLPRRRLLAWTYGFFVGCLLAFAPAFAAQARIGAFTLGVVFFVWVSVFNLFVVSVFWRFMADVFASASARRLFPRIALAGPLLTSLLVGVTALGAIAALGAVALRLPWLELAGGLRLIWVGAPLLALSRRYSAAGARSAVPARQWWP